ncbi:MAG: ABC transporter permease [Tepidisphaeraceae bacterium]
MNLLRHKRELSVAATYALVLLIMAVRRPDFFQSEFRDTYVDNAAVVVAAVGMTLVIICRHIDISIGSQFSICAVSAGLLAKTGLPMPLVAVATVAIGCAMGAANGALVAFMGLPSIVVTLATMVILGQSLSLIRQGATVDDLPPDFQWFGLSQHAGEWMVMLSAAVLLILFAWGMRNLPAGRAVYAVGSDQEAARLSGIRPRRVVFSVFVLMGALTAVASLLRAVRFPQVDPRGGLGLELETIAAVVVGGTAIAGGRGNLFGTLLGVILLGTISAALGFLFGQAYWDKAIQGGIILFAVASDALHGARAPTTAGSPA